MLCTYIGAGTEFVENRFADRRPLQRLLFQDTQGYGIRDENAVQRASAGDVLYLKGHAFPGNSGLFYMPATHMHSWEVQFHAELLLKVSHICGSSQLTYHPAMRVMRLSIHVSHIQVVGQCTGRQQQALQPHDWS